MSDTYAAELRDLIDRAFVAEHNGRATLDMVHASVWRDLPDHLTDYLIGKGLRSRVSAYFGAKDAEGLPKRPEANADGEHAQLDLLSAPEFAYVYEGYTARIAANAEQREKVRRRCMEVHGVDLEPVANTA